MGFTGTIGDVSLLDVLQVLVITAQTGTLALTRPGHRAELRFSQGRFARVQLTPARRQLASQFLERGLVDFETLHQALVRQTRTEKRLLIGQLLVEMGAVTPEQLVQGLRSHVEESVAEVLGWPRGEYAFTEDGSTSDPSSARDPSSVELSPAALAALAERAHTEASGEAERASWPVRARLGIILTNDPLIEHGVEQNLRIEAFSVVRAAGFDGIGTLLLASEDQSPSLIVDLDLYSGGELMDERALDAMHDLHRQWPNLNIVTFGRETPDALYGLLRQGAVSFHVPRPRASAEADLQIMREFVDAVATAAVRAREGSLRSRS
jgi:hypothetical protein